MRGALLLVILGSGFASAQSAETRKDLNTAITLYENLDYEKALEHLKRAHARAVSPDDEAKLSLLEGAVLADLGKEDRALSAFKAGFSVDVDAKLPVDVSPKVQALAERARSSVRKLLAPQLEEARLAEERRLAESKRREAEEAARLEEQRRVKAEVKPSAAVAPTVTVAPVKHPPPTRTAAWVSGAAGVVSAGVAAGFFSSAGTKYDALVKATVPADQALAYRDSGKTDVALGFVFSGVAVAGLTTAAILFLTGAPASETSVAVVPLGDGAFFAWTGTFGR